MKDQVIGASVRRKEDFRFLTGAGNYTDDINRSPHAHAEITGIDTSSAGAAPGIIAVFTAADMHVGDSHGVSGQDSADLGCPICNDVDDRPPRRSLYAAAPRRDKTDSRRYAPRRLP